MQIVEILSEDLIIPDVVATDKATLIEEMSDRICAVLPHVDRDLAVRVLLDREKLGSTGVGHGFAIPHGKLPNLTGVVGCLGRSLRGVDFDSLDRQPAHLFLVLLAPEGSAGVHLKALARASRLFKDAEFRSELMAEESRSGMWRVISAHDARLTQAEELRG